MNYWLMKTEPDVFAIEHLKKKAKRKTTAKKRWNISLFHYRNHGADYGRVLVGIQVPKSSRKEFKVFLKDLGYLYWEETDCPAYQLFLGDN